VSVKKWRRRLMDARRAESSRRLSPPYPGTIAGLRVSLVVEGDFIEIYVERPGRSGTARPKGPEGNLTRKRAPVDSKFTGISAPTKAPRRNPDVEVHHRQASRCGVVGALSTTWVGTSSRIHDLSCQTKHLR